MVESDIPDQLLDGSQQDFFSDTSQLTQDLIRQEEGVLGELRFQTQIDLGHYGKRFEPDLAKAREALEKSLKNP